MKLWILFCTFFFSHMSWGSDDHSNTDLQSQTPSPVELYTSPHKGGTGIYFLNRKEVNDGQLYYAPSDRVSFGFHGIRNHWPQQLELHYALLQINALLLQKKTQDGKWNLFSSTALGMANKLKGINRVAYLLGAEAEYDSSSFYWNATTTTIGAPDYSQKNFIKMRGGYYVQLTPPSVVRTLVLMHALYENQAEHPIEWGPILRIQYEKIAAELFGTFKGRIGFSWSVQY